ncbi:MAG: 3-hydroxyacyl-CoA dehydrogenase family protein [Candidatus Dormibacteraeota bacterium]|nr:3-hydroxyacyl-CoA dehydrogenase family protein [Candidatus Dormibacteraeota bacterium]
MTGERTLAVVGAGTMGGQIAYQAALHAWDVRLIGRREERLQDARSEASKLLRRRVEKGRLDHDECEAALARVVLTTELDHVTEATVVIESVAEDREAKRAVIADIAERLCDEAILGTNSSTMPSSILADRVLDPSRLLNVHFFNPPLVMALVEVVQGPHTSEDSTRRAMEFARSIGKTPVLVARETYGFIANRILFIALQEAMRLVQDGYVSIDDCDLAVHQALGWPMGPFALADLVGLDVVEAILEEGARQTGDSRWEPLPLLRDRVQRGELGRKTGQGFSVS